MNIFFDDQFKMVGAGSGVQQVGANTIFTVLAQSGLTAAKNGFLYVYVSNETPNINVYFDNLQVTSYSSPLLQEQSYYPFGLQMAGISDKALNKLDSKNKFNGGVELEEDYGVNLYETDFRNYDPQLGRFGGIDQLTEQAMGISGYQFGANNPISFNDPNGAKAMAVRDAPPVSGWALEWLNNNVGGIENGNFLGTGGGGDGDNGGNGSSGYSSFWSAFITNANKDLQNNDGDNPCTLQQKTYQFTTIDYFFSQAAYLAVEDVGYRGSFNISGSITTVQVGNKSIATVTISAYSPGMPDNSDGGNNGYMNFYGTISLYANGRLIDRVATNDEVVYNSANTFVSPNDGRDHMPGASFDLPSEPPAELGIGFSITYQYFSAYGGSASPTYEPLGASRAYLNAYKIIYSNYPSK